MTGESRCLHGAVVVLLFLTAGKKLLDDRSWVCYEVGMIGRGPVLRAWLESVGALEPAWSSPLLTKALMPQVAPQRPEPLGPHLGAAGQS